MQFLGLSRVGLLLFFTSLSEIIGPSSLTIWFITPTSFMLISIPDCFPILKFLKKFREIKILNSGNQSINLWPKKNSWNHLAIIFIWRWDILGPTFFTISAKVSTSWGSRMTSILFTISAISSTLSARTSSEELSMVFATWK